MVAVFSPVPLMNRLLEIAQEEAAKKGHVIRVFDRRRELQEVFYSGECVICHATARVVCSAYEYSRVGTAYRQSCKPG